MQNHKKVIQFPSPPLWSFFDYVEGARNPIQDWFDGLSEEAQNTFNTLLKDTQKTSNHLQWGGFKYLKGEPKSEHIWQLDFIADKRQHRLLGVFGGVQKQAVLILGCYHKGDNYTPQDALTTATKRAKNLRLGRAGIRERKIEIYI